MSVRTIPVLLGGALHGQPIARHQLGHGPETIAIQAAHPRRWPPRPGTDRIVAADIDNHYYARRTVAAPTEGAATIAFYVPADMPLVPDSLRLLWDYLLDQAGAR